MSDQGISDLVRENGQLLTRGFPTRSQKIPPCNIGHSFHSSNALSENGRPKFATSDSILDKQEVLGLYKSHFNQYFSEHNHKLIKAPVHENVPTAGNSQAHLEFSLQQQHQISNPLKRPRVKSGPKLLSFDVLPNSKTLRDHQDVEPESKKERVNFSLFLRSLAAPTKSTTTRAEKLQNKPVLLSPAAYGSKSVEGSQNQLDSMDINTNKSVPDVQSEAVNGQAKGKPLDTVKCKETSSSLCSLGASNNPTYDTYKRRHEDTEGSACPRDPNEAKLERKAAPARGSKSNKKKRTPEVHNLSERRRRENINKKLRALQELVPNCNKVDKASMLDEAIEYLKTLQFQVNMISMGSGVHMPPIMLQTGMQQMHAPQMSHFSPMEVGMGMRMQIGVGCIPAQFLIPPIARPTAVPGIFPETKNSNAWFSL